jgi:DNA-binding IclR family transcriptional regulator
VAEASTLGKALGVLDLLAEAEGPVAFEALHAALGFTRSTLYRYLKALQDAGLVTSFPDRGFALGPRVAELDHRMRRSDPLITAARPVMAGLAAEWPGVALLCRRYRDRVLCVHQDGTLGGDRRSTYERGLAMPLLRGAASRVILAHLPGPVVTRLMARDGAGFAEAGLGETPAAVRAALQAIRKRGWDVTEGQVTAGVTGIAVPLLDGAGGIAASLSLTLPRLGLAAAEVAAVAAALLAGAREVSREAGLG